MTEKTILIQETITTWLEQFRNADKSLGPPSFIELDQSIYTEFRPDGFWGVKRSNAVALDTANQKLIYNTVPLLAIEAKKGSHDLPAQELLYKIVPSALT